MQPSEGQEGVSSRSQLFDSLKVYLNNKNRLQPIIGLGSIVECVKVGTQNREALYLCEVCVCRLSKADMRNHILGSLHRFNYIKAWHPHLLSERQENSDLSKLAWPLMEMAKRLEGEEGPGDVQLVEVEDAVYQKMATRSEKDAVTLINSLRAGQGEPESYATTISLHYPISSQRVVLPAQDQRRRPKKSIKTEMKSYKVSPHTNMSPPLICANVAPSVKSEVWLRDISSSQLDNAEASPEASVLSENSNSFLDDYTGTTPLIGLCRIVECRSEDGCSYCFLCHCCRIRANKKDIIDHLTSSSHLINYLMETHQVEVVTADMKDNYQLLQSLAKKVEQVEGRGELKVVNAPESLCMLLTGKSYHWCIKMLCSGRTHTNVQKKGIAIKGPSVDETVQGVPDECAVTLSKQAKRVTTKRKTMKRTNTVFNVNMPVTKGSMLLERTSFSMDFLPGESASPSSDLDLIPLPKSQIEDCETALDCDTTSLAVDNVEPTLMRKTSELQQGLHSRDGDAGQFIPETNLTITLFQDVDGHASDTVRLNQSEDITGTEDHKMYGESKYDRQHGCHEVIQTQNERLSLPVSHTQDWSSSYRHEEGCTEQWYNSTSESEVGSRVEMSSNDGYNYTSSDAMQYYYQQHLQNQYMAGYNTGLLTGSVGHHNLSGEQVPYLDAARVHMQTHLRDPLMYSGSIAPQPRVQYSETEQRRLQAYMEFTADHVQTAPLSYTTQSTAYQGNQVDPNSNIRPMTNPDHHFPHPVSSSSGGGGGGMTQSNNFIKPGQALCYGADSVPNFRGAGWPGFMISGNVDGRTPYMISYPNSEYVATPR